ncbi:MAG: ammonia-forming cytochrome c nitrite reductase subunit c552 [Prolixibacteraceae bacterium]
MKSNQQFRLLTLPILTLFSVFFQSCTSHKSSEEFTGSSTCIECHAKFYELWSGSHHGLAMQPITSKFIANEIQTNQEAILMEKGYYTAIVKDTSLIIQEVKNEQITNYEVIWALGGKNVYYFLTALDGGRLQTLPLAYNLNTKLWYNNPASAIRHFPQMGGHNTNDEALPWKHRQYTFNTSCYSCHVSQLSNNFDLASNTYQTNWKESGINCETCHGPASEHVNAARLAEKKGVPLDDLKLIVTKTFTPEQHNASCAPCHAKMRAITPSYTPGDKYFDNYDLITLESTDFYPDGRDLGENYTMTGWHMNACAKAGELHCVTCHTSSGRYRFKSNDLTTANKACTSCHSEKEEHYEQHTHHAISSISPKCIDCHMPKTTFGHMDRSDHSFRPPMPMASLEFQSPNACNLCHSNQDAKWAQQQLFKWKKDNGYQDKTMAAGRLLVDARTEKWEHSNEIMEAIKTNKYGEVYTTSFLRLMVTLDNPQKKEAAFAALKFDSPLIRSAAASALYGFTDLETGKNLLKAAQDEILLVRLAAALPLTIFDQMAFTPDEQTIIQKVSNEYTQSLITRPDDWSAYYNLGNYYQNTGQTEKALISYETATKLAPDAILPLVNSSYLLSVNGNQEQAQLKLEKALLEDPMNEAANFNYGLLMAEVKNMDAADKALRKVLQVNNKNAAAAYNLAIIVSAKNPDEAIQFSKNAMEAAPDQPKYGYTYAFFLNQSGKTGEAQVVLTRLINLHPTYVSSAFLLANIYEKTGKKKQALAVYEKALKANANNEQVMLQLQQNLERLKRN